MKQIILLASAAMIGVTFLTAPAKAQGELAPEFCTGR